MWSISLFQTASSEYQRITSPDGLVDAIIIYRDSGATSPGSYQLYIVQRGRIVTEEKDIPVFGAEAYQLKLSWVKDKDLQIDCKHARIGGFSNFWFSKDIQDYRYIVEIRISPTCRHN